MGENPKHKRKKEQRRGNNMRTERGEGRRR